MENYNKINAEALKIIAEEVFRNTPIGPVQIRPGMWAIYTGDSTLYTGDGGLELFEKAMKKELGKWDQDSVS